MHKYTSFLYIMQAWFFIFLFSDLSVSENNIFCCRQRFQSHRSSCMQLLRTDPDFRAKPKFKSICKSGGRIDIHCCCIDLILKTQRTVIIFCNDRLGMSGIIPVYLLKFFSISFSISRILVFHLSLCQCFCQFWDHFIHMLFFNDKRRYQTQYIALCLDHKKSFLNGTVIYLRDRLL